MVSHLNDRFYLVTRIVLPTKDYIKIRPVRLDMTCHYLREN